MLVVLCIVSPRLSGSRYCEDLLVKIPIIKLLGIFFQSRYCEDHVKRGLDNRGPTVLNDKAAEIKSNCREVLAMCRYTYLYNPVKKGVILCNFHHRRLIVDSSWVVMGKRQNILIFGMDISGTSTL